MVKLPEKVDAQHNYGVFRNIRIPMRDGVELSTNLFFPAENGEVNFEKTYPAILIRTAYAFENGEFATQPINFPYYANDLGYVVVLQSSRGTYLSGGELKPMYYEAADGVDTAEWIVKQPWSNGKIATTGHSWLGGTEYLLHLEKDVPGLVTGVIRCPSANAIDSGFVYDGEFADQGCIAAWPFTRCLDCCTNGHVSQDVIDGIMADNAAFGEALTNPEGMDIYGWQAQYSLKDIPYVRHLPFYQEWLNNRDNPEYFAHMDTRIRPNDMDRPLLFSGAWNDLFLDNVLRGYEKAVQDAPSKEIAEGHRLIMGPWGHMYMPFPGMRDFPANADTDDRIIAMEWIDSQLTGRSSEFFDENRVTMYVMGENRWCSEKAWPLEDVVVTPWYLHSNGNANTANGDGVLNTSAPGEEVADKFTSDPMNPVYAPGGHSLFAGAQADQSEVEQREDVLVYTSEVLAEDVEVTGYIHAKLFFSTSSDDTDIVIKLIDVTPEGVAYNVTSGARRARYIKGGRSNPQPVVPGEVLECDVELRATSYVFKKGHKIRIDICGSDALNREVGFNKFIDLNTSTRADGVQATQTVFHDALRASVIELPVVPVDHERVWIDEWPFDAAQTGMEMNKSMTMIPGWDVIMTPPAALDCSNLPVVDAVFGEKENDDVHSARDAIRF